MYGGIVADMFYRFAKSMLAHFRYNALPSKGGARFVPIEIR